MAFNKYMSFKFIGLLILIYLLITIDIKMMIAIILKSNPIHLTSALVFMFIHVYIKFLRYQFILIQQGVNNPFIRTAHYSLAAIYISFITPGRIGEISKAYFIHKDLGIPLNRLFAGSILDRIFEIFALLIIALFAFIIVLPTKNNIPIIIFILAISLTPAIFLIKSIRFWLIRLLGNIQNKFFNSDSLAVNANRFFSEINALLNWKILFGVAATIAAYALFFTSCYFMGLSIDIPLPYYKVAIFIACANILSFLPVSFAGIGTREACLVYFFSLERLSSESALAFSTIVFSLTYILFGFIGFICFMTLKQGKKQWSKNV
jgi:glycosyltransferase 2 family protein